jgi:hypothetical protein
MAERLAKTAVLGLAAAVAACVTGQPTTVRPASGALTVAQLSATLPGQSLVMTRVDGSGGYCAWHSLEARPGGSRVLTGTDGGSPYRGLWRIEPQPNAESPADPGFVCYSFPDAGVFAECRMLQVGETGVTVLDRYGRPYATGALQPGDACG